MTQTLHTDRTRIQTYQRCKRLRFWEYSGGSTGLGITPVKLSIHLVIGGTAHVGLANLVGESQQALSGIGGDKLDDKLLSLFDRLDPATSIIARIEDRAVAAALAELRLMTEHGVQLDDQELLDAAALVNGVVAGAPSSPGFKPLAGGDSVIQIDFSDYMGGSLEPTVAPTSPAGDLANPELAEIEIANTNRAMGVDDYLLSELAVLIEGMIRAYSRRRLRPLLEQYEILEVEREGQWKLADVRGHAGLVGHPADGSDCDDCCSHVEIMFNSRHDGLLRDRNTDQLYLLSYKTTGSWDRRKASDAQTDMQGLSEAVDVENRLGEAWQILHQSDKLSKAPAHLSTLADTPTLQWLTTQTEPPRILGVRYEYLIKGSRKADEKDADQPGRYTFQSPLVRAYRQDGITSDDRKWATHYNWWDQFGKKSTINYRSWQKSAVWKYMTAAQWIDLLDSNKVQPDSYNESGTELLDTLAEQFIPPIVVYRNDDDMRDMLEQIEAQEITVARDVAAVAAAADEGERRSLLNVLFPQSRQSCSYPGRCSMHEICYGGSDIRQNPESSGLYRARTPNHPQELETT